MFCIGSVTIMFFYSALALSDFANSFAFMCPHLEISAAVFYWNYFHRNPKFVPLEKKNHIIAVK